MWKPYRKIGRELWQTVKLAAEKAPQVCVSNFSSENFYHCLPQVLCWRNSKLSQRLKQQPMKTFPICFRFMTKILSNTFGLGWLTMHSGYQKAPKAGTAILVKDSISVKSNVSSIFLILFCIWDDNTTRLGIWFIGNYYSLPHLRIWIHIAISSLSPQDNNGGHGDIWKSLFVLCSVGGTNSLWQHK